MTADPRLQCDRFPRSSRYHPDWVIGHASGGANSLWLAEWLTEAMELRPGMRVLDLGCGRACSSIFLHREFGVQVWAVDLWISASENAQRIRDAGAADSVFPLRADARSLPFAPEFFDAIVSVDAFPYFGTDELYLNYLAHFVKPRGCLGVAGAGLTREVEGIVPDPLREFWGQGFYAFHSAEWWRRHWERPEIVDVELADTLQDGWRYWVDWHRAIAPDNTSEIQAVELDAGQHLGYVRFIARRREDARFDEHTWPPLLLSLPVQYTQHPLLKNDP